MRWKWFRKRRSLLRAFFVATQARDRKIANLEAQLDYEREQWRTTEIHLQAELRVWRHSAIRHREDFERAAIERDKLKAKLK